MFGIIRLGFKQTETKSNNCEWGKQENLMPVSWLTVVRAWVISTTHLPVMAITLTCYYRAAFPADATIITLQTREPCFHVCYWAPVLPFTCTKSHPNQGQLQEACTACPKEAQQLLGNSTFFPTSITTPNFTHFITLDFLFYFWQPLFSFPEDNFLFIFSLCICSSYTAFIIFVFHSVLPAPMLLKPYITPTP